MPQDETEVFQHYRVLRRDDGSLWELGRGAMGVTYKAVDTNLETPVALKVINALLVNRPSARERFIREARAAASLRHRNVASVYHLGNDGQHFFYAMEFIDGETVEHLVRRAGPQPWQASLRLVLQVSRALMAAHEKRLVHRDIKPANLMLLEEAGEHARIVKLIDFGLAKSIAEEGEGRTDASGTGFLGTPLYASPEQCDEIAPDIRSDLYSLGVTFWYLLAGRPPFLGSLSSILSQHLHAPPPWEQLPGSVPPAVRALLARLLAKDRADRPQTPADLRGSAEECLRVSGESSTGSVAGTAVHLPWQTAESGAAPAPTDATLIEIPSVPTTLVPDPARTLAEPPDVDTRVATTPAKSGLPLPIRAQPARATPGIPIPPSAREPTRVHPAVSWQRRAVALAAVAVLAVAAVSLRQTMPAWWPGLQTPAGVPGGATAPGAVSEKSIAVLPFESLSDEKSNAYFAQGIQDEILTDLAKVADLKVISRTSVMAFGAGHARNAREIGVALGVAHLLEGSVQRTAGRIRVTAQLIDARTDLHLWAEHYDGDLADIFALQSRMAEQIAASLRAKLSPGEKAAIDAPPTTDLAAYDLYLQAKDLVSGFQQTADWRETLLHAVRLLEEATRRDNDFELAWCLAAKAHDQLYFFGLDATPARLTLQENAVATAFRLSPDLGERHLTRALLLYHGRRDYAGARRELAVARAVLPNNAELFSLLSYLDRREGRWPEAKANQDRAFSLDPRNPGILNDQMVLADMLRLYPEEIRVAEAGAAAIPASADYFKLMRAQALLEGGQTAAASTQLDTLPANYDPNGATTYTRVCVALYNRRPAEAAAVLAAFKGGEYPGVNGLMTPRAWLEALVVRAAGDDARARSAFLEARGVADAGGRQRPEDPAVVALLGQIDAGLGRKDDALREGRRAVEMRPISADAMDGPGLEAALALICAWTGEPDLAMEHLTLLAKTPGGPDYGQLRFDPAWEPLRGRADFQQMVARLEPRVSP